MTDKSNDKEVLPEVKFMANVSEMINLMQDITESCEKRGIDIISPLVIGLIGIYIRGKEATHIIDTFIKKSYEHWDIIREKNKSFFIEKSLTVFGDLPINNVKDFTTFFSHKDTVRPADLECIWEFFHSLVKIAIKYVHMRRRPSTRMNNGTVERVYESRFFDNVNVLQSANNWNITLNFN